MWIALSVAAIVIAAFVVFMNQPSFGRLPRGQRLERIENSPNYLDGQFRNLSPTPHLVSDKSRARVMLDFLLRKVDGLRPDKALPAVKTDLKAFAPDEDVAVWLGHSSLFIQVDGLRLLVDPVLVKAAPVSFVNKPFMGTDIYTPDDLPSADCLIVTHDHWDHLDYGTVTAIKDRIGEVICPLGVGEHFERWGFDKDRIVELDWDESVQLGDGFAVHCLPSRHFSGRGAKANRTLWASFMIQTPEQNIYLSGDGGYDAHFAAIAARFGRIDLAFMENGQYNEQWRDIHLLPADLVRAVNDLNPMALITVHHSKYALGKHPWNEPLDNIAVAAGKDSLNLLTPKIGQPVYWNDPEQVFEKWWLAAE